MWEEQVSQSVQVELNHVALKLDVEVGHRLQNTEHLNNSSRRETWLVLTSLNSESLTRTSLTVGKNRHVVPINSGLNKSLSVVEDLILS